MEKENLKLNAIIPSADIENIFDWSLSKQMEEEYITKIKEEEDRLIMDAFKKCGIDINIEEEKTRRFKRFVIEHQGNKRYYWFNDGSINGELLFIVQTAVSPISSTEKGITSYFQTEVTICNIIK